MIFLAFLLMGMSYGKIYDRCELARELKYVHKAPNHQLAIWVCIAENESQYNTSIVGHLNGDGSGDHGIFQISDKFWCSPPGKGYACGLNCSELEDDDLYDDFICAQKIYKEHKQLSGDGFNAWAVYQPHCKGSKSDRYVKDCFNDSEQPKLFGTPPSDFAHGFFDTAVGKAPKGFSVSTQKPIFEPFISVRSSSIVQNPKFMFPFEKPVVNSFPAPKSFFLFNRFSTSTERLNDEVFFTPTITTFKPAVSATASFIPATTESLTNHLMILNPTPSTLAAPPFNQFPIFEFKKTFTPPSNRVIFNPPASTSAYPSSSMRYPAPIFIINGVKWY